MRTISRTLLLLRSGRSLERLSSSSVAMRWSRWALVSAVTLMSTRTLLAPLSCDIFSGRDHGRLVSGACVSEETSGPAFRATPSHAFPRLTRAGHMNVGAAVDANEARFNTHL